MLPEEKTSVENLARKIRVKVKIVPRLAVGKEFPEKVIAYQMMGKNSDGNVCPFLDVEGKERSPHGGFNCRIYSERPLACRAYPVIDVGKASTLDGHCQFCKKFSTTRAQAEGLGQEIEALAKIKSSITAGESHVWRYATASGHEADVLLPEGWVAEF